MGEAATSASRAVIDKNVRMLARSKGKKRHNYQQS